MSEILAPHIRQTEKASILCGDVLIALTPLLIFSTVIYGARPLLLALTGMGAALLFEAVCCFLSRRSPRTLLDGTAAVTGALIGMMCSPLTPYWAPVVGAAFAIFIAKAPFGGTGRNLFNPAAAGMAFLTLCFGQILFTYPEPNTLLPLATGDLGAVITAPSPAATLQGGGNTVLSLSELLLGQYPGPIGGTAILLLLAGGLYLLFRRAISPWITLSYLTVCTAFALLFPRAPGGPWNSVVLELCSGALLFCGIFLINDPTTSPGHWLSRLIYGALCGLLVMLLRQNGRFEEGACFAILLMNTTSTVIDRWGWKLSRLTLGFFRRLRKKEERL